MTTIHRTSTSITSGMHLNIMFGSRTTSLRLSIGEYRRDGFYPERTLSVDCPEFVVSPTSVEAWRVLDDVIEALCHFRDTAKEQGREMRIHD